MILKLRGNESLQFLQTFKVNHIEWNSIYCLDLSNINFATPVICVITQIFRFKNIQIQWPQNPAVRSYIKWLLNGTFYNSQRYIATLVLDNKTFVPTVAKDFYHLFQRWIQEKAADDLKYALSELMDNVFDHAKSEIGVCISAQKYADRIELCVADLGIGIANSFQNHINWPHVPLIEWFKFGLRMKGTSKPGEHSGEGLSSVLNWLKNNSGCYSVLFSQNHIWELSNGVELINELPYLAWPGTLVWFSIPFRLNVSLNMIWEQFNLNIDELNDLFD